MKLSDYVIHLDLTQLFKFIHATNELNTKIRNNQSNDLTNARAYILYTPIFFVYLSQTNINVDTWLLDKMNNTQYFIVLTTY